MIDLTSDIAIFTGGMLAHAFIAACFFNKNFIAFEERYIFTPLHRLWRGISRFIRFRLKNNTRFMAWLNKPQKHGKPDVDFITGQVKVWGDYELIGNIR